MTSDQPDQGTARGYSWPPFVPGHERSVQHGARSERRIGPLAASIETAARSDPSWPQYLTGPAYRAAVTSWARAEAVCELLWRFLDERDVTAALSETTETDETIEHTTGRSKRMTTSRRTTAALDAWQRAQRDAAAHRARLGLDPTSRAKLGRDVSTADAMRAASLDDLRRQGRAALAGRTDALIAPESGEQNLTDRQEPTDV